MVDAPGFRSGRRSRLQWVRLNFGHDDAHQDSIGQSWLVPVSTMGCHRSANGAQTAAEFGQGS